MFRLECSVQLPVGCFVWEEGGEGLAVLFSAALKRAGLDPGELCLLCVFVCVCVLGVRGFEYL